MKKIKQIGGNEQGSVAIITAVSMVVIFGLAALAIDYGKLQATYAKMRTAADAGALAGVTRNLWSFWGDPDSQPHCQGDR